MSKNPPSLKLRRGRPALAWLKPRRGRQSSPPVFNVPYNNGTCKVFLKVFLEGPDRGRKNRLQEMENVEGEEDKEQGLQSRRRDGRIAAITTARSSKRKEPRQND
jgi:hypothetical protein